MGHFPLSKRENNLNTDRWRRSHRDWSIVEEHHRLTSCITRILTIYHHQKKRTSSSKSTFSISSRSMRNEPMIPPSKKIRILDRPSPPEAVERAALALEGVDDVHGGDGLPASVLGVGDRVADDVLKENLEDAPRLLVDQAADALNSAAPSQAADRRLGDPLDVISEHLAVTLGAALPQPLSSLSTARHGSAACSTKQRTMASEINSSRRTFSLLSGKSPSSVI
ncbi:unnamed protein product [Spirodela intermedia]|uniref:Uncharacterized protein n=1 Tax=Spirodela intermedia TaxID=51605 RepID=A0A7I8LHV2_SPIIN|nr:unnamed protein product [Spirodela intermedia]